jgi:glutaminyl-tRNA synthetase
MPTIAGLRRRGYTPEAIREFCEQIGISKSNSTVDIEFLEHCVRDDLKLKTETRNVVFDPIKVIITNYPEDREERILTENNREAPELGERELPFGRELYIDGEDFMETPARKYYRLFPGNEVRLKGAYFITCEEVVKNEDGTIKALLCTYDPDTKSGSGFEARKVKGTIHWVDAKTAATVVVREYEYLMIANESGEEVLNPDSARERVCFAEPSAAEAQPGQRFQFFRHGYYVAEDGADAEPAGSKVFNRIVGLKSSWKK